MELGPYSNILVCGAEKSGTTALLYSIAAALGGRQRIHFEPSSPEHMHLGRGAHNLCKLIIDGTVDAFVPTFPRFDKRVFIVRDPRDVLVSRLLYKVRDQKFIFDEERLQRLLTALARKEADADALDIVDLARLIGELEGVSDYLEKSIGMALRPMHVWQELGDQFQMLRYEDFVRGDTEALARYLGFPLSNNVEVPEWVQRVNRTKTGGDWRNWFTRGDVDALRQHFVPYLEFFDYPDDWDLPRERRVNPEHGSRYVAWIVDLRRSGRG
jgi:hypothetical protein